MKSTSKTWLCPYCDHTVPYGSGCASDNLQTCTLGNKNIHYDARIHYDRRFAHLHTKPVSIGIAEIANHEEQDSNDDQ